MTTRLSYVDNPLSRVCDHSTLQTRSGQAEEFVKNPWNQVLIKALVFSSFLFIASAQAASPQFQGVHRDLPVPGSQRSVAVGDFNGDGILDFAEASSEGYNSAFVLVIALGTASHSYTYTELPLMALSGGVSAADVNGDGKLDIVAVGDYVQVFLGNGDGTFLEPTNAFVGSQALSQVLADMDGDGKLDLVLGLSSGIQILWGNGDGTFAFGENLTSDSDVVAAVADFNGDSIPDVVSAGNTYVVVFLGLGGGLFQMEASQRSAGSVNGLAVADFNQDHIPDVAVSYSFDGFSSESSGISVFLGSGNGTLQQTASMTALTPSAFTGVTAGDFDGDGKPDLVALFGTGPGADAPDFDSVTVFHGNGDGTFGSGSSTPVGNHPEAAVPVDLNGDGHLDLIVSDLPLQSTTYGVSILFGLGNRSFVQAKQIHGEANSGTAAVAAGDFNGDGLPDVITANARTKDVSVFLNQGSALQSPVNSPAGLVAGLLVVGDVNNDGILDAVVAGCGSLNASVLLGKGDGSFLPPSTVPLGGRKPPTQIAMTDFNGDGILDLVAVEGTRQVYVSFGLGGGLFAPPLVLQALLPRTFLAVGDVNGDGYPDILTYSEGSAEISEFLSNGNGTFSSVIYVLAEVNPGNLTLADVNGDGILDALLLVHPLVVGLGVGDGTFGPFVSPGNYSFVANAMTVGDFNGDGKLDVALVVSDSNSVVVLSGKGDGTFTNADSYATRYYPTAITAFDLNGDGKPDIITSNASGISILPNNTP